MFINWKRLLLAVWRLEEGQQEILAQLEKLQTPHPSPAATPSPQGEGLAGDEWVQKGIDNIMSFSVGKKKEDA